MKLNIKPDERLILLAKTGSGKTEWAKYMLRLVSVKMPVVIIDPKNFWLGKHPKWETKRKEPGTIDKPHLVRKFNPKFRVQVFQPDADEGKDDPDLLKLCSDILKHGNIFVYFDEIDGVATAQHVPTAVRKLWKQGRALGIGAWVATQVPTGIPKIFKSQAEKFVVMKCGKEDEELAANLCQTSEEEIADLRPYEWILYDNRTMEEGEWQPPLPFRETKAA